MKKLFTALLCAFCLSAYAERAVTNVSVTANGTTAVTTNMVGLATATSYVDLDSMYISCTNGTSGTVSVITKVDGYSTTLFEIPYKVTTNTNTVFAIKEFSPRRVVTSNQYPDTDKFRLFGTNTVIQVVQDVASTNAWSFILLYSKD